MAAGLNQTGAMMSWGLDELRQDGCDSKGLADVESALQWLQARLPGLAVRGGQPGVIELALGEGAGFTGESLWDRSL